MARTFRSKGLQWITQFAYDPMDIAWNTWSMKVSLPDLGADFRVTGINAGNTCQSKSSDATFAVRPGVYLLERTGRTPSQL
jgi:hypothetical protein